MQPSLSRRELLKQIALGSALVAIPAATSSVPAKQITTLGMGWIHGAKREEIRTTTLKTEILLDSRSLNDVRVAVTYSEPDAFYKNIYPVVEGAGLTLFRIAEQNKWEMAENQRTALRRYAVNVSNWVYARSDLGLPASDMLWSSLVEYAKEQVTVATPEDYANPKPRLSMYWRKRDDGEFARGKFPNATELLHLDFDEVYTECFRRVGSGNQIYDPTLLAAGRDLLAAPTRFRFTEEEMAFYDFKVTGAIMDTPAWRPLRTDPLFLAAMNRYNERLVCDGSQYQEFLDGRRLIIPSPLAVVETTSDLLADYGDELRRHPLDVPSIG